VANAHVTLERLSTHELASTHTATDGTFAVAKLAAETYQLSISAQGFQSIHQTITILPQQAASISVALVSISATKSESRKNQSSEISDLPLNGRSASDVAALEPGVATARTQTSGEAQRGFGTQMTISGSRPRQN